MSKKKSIISYDKLNIDQKKQLLIAFPEGFSGSTTKMTNPITGDIFDALLWETEEIVYLVKLPKVTLKSPSVDDDDEEDFEDDFDSADAKGEEEDDVAEDDDDDSYDDAPDEAGGEDEDED